MAALCSTGGGAGRRRSAASALAAARALAVAVAVAVAMALGAAPAAAIERRCSACAAVAKELHRRLSSDKPRNALDMRGRINSAGERQGRMISYKDSELRITETLDDLCEDMSHHFLTNGEWGTSSAGVNRMEKKAMSKSFQFYCSTLIEKHEDAIVERIRAGSAMGETPRDVEDTLCVTMDRSCDPEL